MALQTISQLIWGPSNALPATSIEQPVPIMAGIVPPAPVTPPETWSDLVCTINQAVTAHPVVAALGIVAGYFLLKGEDQKRKTAARTQTRRTR